MTIEHDMEVHGGDMTRPLIDKMSPAYIAACVEEMPTLKDPNEVMIRGRVKELLASTSLATRMNGEVSLLVEEGFRDLYTRRSDPDYVHRRNQEYVGEFARITNATIVSGEEHLKELGEKSPIILSANHDATYRMGGGLTPEKLKKLGFDGQHDIEDIHYPHIPYYGAFQPVVERLGNNISMVCEEEPGTLGELYRATGSLDVQPAGMIPGGENGKVGRVDLLIDAARELFQKYPNSALVVFPEGGTTGKRNGGNMRELGKFHTGLFVMAARLEVPVLLTAYRFNPNKGFEVSILGVVRLREDSTREEIKRTASHAQELTQTALDSLHTSK